MTKPVVIYLGPDKGYEAANAVLADMAVVLNVIPEACEVSRLGEHCIAIIDASMRVMFDADIFSRVPGLRTISCATTGANHIDHDVAARHEVTIHTLREDGPLLQDITPAAELSWALLMACARNLPAAVRHVQQGLWERELFPGPMLKGKRLGLIGFGRIGSWMSRYAQAFGMEVIGNDPFLDALPDGIQAVSLVELFRTSDFVSLHLHLSAETEGLISRDLLEDAKPGLILINTSRGPLADEAALLDGLISGQIAAAGLDVLDGEPDIADHPLVRYAKAHDNLLITPHCGGYSPDALQIVCGRAAEKVAGYLND